MQVLSGIYSISFQGSNRVYIGSSKNLRKRKTSHLSELRRGVHANTFLQNAFIKYSESSFIFTHLEIIDVYEKSYVLSREQFYIDSLKATDRSFGYNMARIAGSNEGTGNSQEEKRKAHSIFMKGKAFAKGSKRSPEHLEWQRISSTGRKVSEDTKLKISLINKGKVVPEERRQRISETLKGSKLKESTKDIIRKKHAVYSEEQIREIRVSREKGMSAAELAGLFKCTPTTISRICSRQRYGWVE